MRITKENLMNVNVVGSSHSYSPASDSLTWRRSEPPKNYLSITPKGEFIVHFNDGDVHVTKRDLINFKEFLKKFDSEIVGE